MKLTNNKLTVEISSFGAEVKSIVKNDVEYMWQADPLYWKRSSPVLFPIVGKLIDDEYTYKGKKYSMTQHGFARDHEFKCIKASDTECLFLLTDNEESLKKYPFHFNLYIKYQLIGSELIVTWKVENTNQEEMYFQIGAHPAFNFENGSSLDINQTINQYKLGITPHIHTINKNIDIKSIQITNDTFSNDALVFDKVEKIVLRDRRKEITVECPGFPYLGIWSKRSDGINAPFVCIEPWHGITDFANHDKKIENKVGINRLESKETFESSYKIIIK